MLEINCPLSKMTIIFPPFPEDCQKIVFVQGQKIAELTTKMLSSNAKMALVTLAFHFDLPIKDEHCVIHINKRDTLHIDLNGEAVIFYRDNNEDFYWDSQELQDAPEEVMGAICGHLTTVKNNPFEDDKFSSLGDNYRIVGYQIISDKGFTFNHIDDQIIRQKDNLANMLSSARASFPHNRWMINTVFEKS
jgi:hypothetical protein